MKNIEINKLSLDELKALHKQVDRAIESYEDRRKKEALAAIDETAKEFGFNLAELTGQKIKKPVKAKYVNPNDKTQTWTGRGRKPRWVVEALESGKTLEDLEI